MTTTHEELSGTIDLTAGIVAAYVGNNHVATEDLPRLIADVFKALTVATTTEPPVPEPVPLVPAVSARKSITDDYLICLEDGQKFKSLKRHLMAHYNLTPEDYRRKWNLPSDYPMVAPAYAAARSQMALSMGLGRKKGAKVATRPRAAKG